MGKVVAVPEPEQSAEAEAAEESEEALETEGETGQEFHKDEAGITLQRLLKAFLGLVLIQYGIVPLLHQLNVSGFAIYVPPGIITTQNPLALAVTIIYITSLMASAILLVETIREIADLGLGLNELLRLEAVLMSLVLLVIGLTFIGKTGAIPTVINGLYVFTGLTLIYDGIKGF